MTNKQILTPIFYLLIIMVLIVLVWAGVPQKLNQYFVNKQIQRLEQHIQDLQKEKQEILKELDLYKETYGDIN